MEINLIDEEMENLIDEEMENLIDDAIDHAEEMAMESAKQFDVTSEHIGKVIEDSERSTKKVKRVKTDIGSSLIFVSKEAIDHMKYVQNLREFLKMEASRMVEEILEKRKKEGSATRGKKRSRRN
jgi:hypothetical protein